MSPLDHISVYIKVMTQDSRRYHHKDQPYDQRFGSLKSHEIRQTCQNLREKLETELNHTANDSISHAHEIKLQQKLSNKAWQSFLVNKQMYEERVAPVPQKRVQKLLCLLFSKTSSQISLHLTTLNLYPLLEKTLALSIAFFLSFELFQWITNLRGSWEPLNLQPVGQKCKWCSLWNLQLVSH